MKLEIVRAYSLNMFRSKMPVKIHRQPNRFMTKDGFEGIHIATSFEEVKREAMAEVVAAPRFHPWIVLLERFNRLVNLTSTHEPSKLAHEHPV